MAHRRIAAIDLESALKEELEKYGSLASSVVTDVVKEVAEGAEAKLHAATRFSPTGHPTGEYARGWDTTSYQSGAWKSTAIVYNVDNYRLTHLLEFGHVMRNGTGRDFGRAPAYAHIAPVNDWAQDEFIRQVERRLENI